jgi:NADH-quinone oxidoreductase subunit L
MGGLRTRMRTTFVVYLIGALALAGIWPLAGFWSKDEILAEELVLNPTVYWLLTIAAFFTAFYMGRQLLLVFFGEPRSEAAAHARENPPLITVPLMILAFFSAFSGLFNLPWLHTFTSWLEHTIEVLHPGEFNLQVALVSTGLALLGFLLSWLIYSRRYRQLLQLPPARRPDDPLQPVLGPVFSLLEHKYWIDEIYALLILRPYKALCRLLAEVVDWRFWHDWFHDSVIWRSFNSLAGVLSGPVDLGLIDGLANGLANTTIRLAGSLRHLQTGFVRSYALAVFVGVVAILGYLIFR